MRKHRNVNEKRRIAGQMHGPVAHVELGEGQNPLSLAQFVRTAGVVVDVDSRAIGRIRR